MGSIWRSIACEVNVMRYKKKQKYNNKKTSVNGISFDSQKEARRYQELVMLERSGLIKNLERQVKYILIPAQYETVERYGKKGQKLKDGQKLLEREVAYVADFVYEENGETIVEDIKGYRDPSSAGFAKFIIKRKMMLYFHNIKIKEI